MMAGSSTAESTYRLRVRQPQGKVRTIEVYAPTAERAISAAESGGDIVERVWETRLDSPAAVGGRFPLVLFSRKLATLVRAGVNLAEAVDALTANETAPVARQVLTSLGSHLRRGRRFSEALSAWPQCFPQVYVAVVGSAEHTGMLSEALSRFVAYEEEVHKLRSKLAAASIYPAILLLVGGLVGIFLMGFVIPRFAAAYDMGQRNIPLLSRWVIDAGLYVGAHKAAFGAVLCGMVGVGVLLAQHDVVRRWMHAFVVSLPWVSDLANRYSTARFLRAISMLLHSGMPLSRSIEMAGAVLPPVHRAKLVRSQALLAEGRRFSEALGAAGVSTPISASLVKVGERSGQLAQALESCARLEEEDFERQIDLLSRVVEPALMIVMGLLIGGVVALMYMPIFDLAGAFQ